MHVESSLERRLDVDANKRSVRSQEKLVELIEAGEAERAEQHWRNHMRNAARLVLDVAGRKSVVDLFD
jgi:DNA-binding GntR family transcriptional regulator